MASKPEPLKKDTGQRSRVFSYSKGDVSLTFTLRTDINIQLKDFLELLESAVVDVKEELESKK